MIKFFRHIRQTTIMENSKTSRYLKYAIGEIILVVIGILIALQINNWNESSKTIAKVRTMILALRNDLVQDTILITNKLPGIIEQSQLNETIRARVAAPRATLDTLINIARFKFNPTWSNEILYNTNAYSSLNDTGLIENLPDTLKSSIKNFYNYKYFLIKRIDRNTDDYRNKVASFVDTYSFGSTELHDQGVLIDSLIWQNIDSGHLAARFQGITNFRRIHLRETREELEFSLSHSKKLIEDLDIYLKHL